MVNYENPQSYVDSRVETWYSFIRNYGADLEFDGVNPNEIDGLLNLYYFSPSVNQDKRQEATMIDRTRLYLQGVKYKEIADYEVFTGQRKEAAARFTIAKYVNSRLPKAIATELIAMDNAEPGMNLEDVFRSDRLIHMTELMEYKGLKGSGGSLSQSQMEYMIQLYREHSIKRGADWLHIENLIERVEGYLRCRSLGALATKQGIKRSALINTVTNHFPNAVIREYNQRARAQEIQNNREVI